MAIQIEGGKTPLLTVKELEQIGYNVVVYPISTLYAASWAVKRLMEELMDHGTTKGSMEKMITFNDFNELVGLPLLREKELSYYQGET
jgi:2-methylisocitrate lyase-like PEP mutase family enzyme